MTKKSITMNVDFFDEVSIRKHPFCQADVEELISRCAQSGVDTIFWRAAGLGVAGYPSKLLLSPQELEDSDMSSFFPRLGKDLAGTAMPKEDKHFVLNVQEQNRYREHMGQWGKRLATSLEKMDPIFEAQQACKKHGIAFYIWFDYQDERHNRALAEHSKWLVTGRDGTTRFPGLRSYAVPDAVNNQMEVIKELLGYKPDGLYLSTSCHNRHLEFPEEDDFFGYEKPVIAKCQERGVDISEESFDSEVWHDVKGGFVTDFFRKVRQATKPLGIKLAIGTQLGPETIFTSPVFSTHVPYRFATQWKQWIDEDIADILILGDYEWPWDNVPIWDAKNMHWPQGTYAANQEWKTYAQYNNNRVQLYWFSSWLSAYAAGHEGASAGSLQEAMEMRAQTIANTAVHGICLHEVMTFEQEVGGFEMVAAMRRSWDNVS